MLIMIFTFRPCNRRAHYRKRRVPRFVASLLLSLLCITAVVVLLLLAPQWGVRKNYNLMSTNQIFDLIQSYFYLY